MSLRKINPRTLVLFLLILAVGLCRVFGIVGKELSAFSNFTPIGAMAIFGGAYFKNGWKAFGLPLITLFFGDIFLSLFVFPEFRTGLLYSGWYWTYAAFALMVLTGRLVIKKSSVLQVILASLICTGIHWIVSDIGAWQMGIQYPKTMAGYLACLVAAIPYEGNFLAGALLYGSCMFAGFEWMQKRYSSLRLA